MCGGGSIPIEGALAFQNGFFIGGDNHNLAAERTANNLKVFDRKIQADSLQWDVTNIPLKGWFKFFSNEIKRFIYFNWSYNFFVKIDSIIVQA